MPFIRIQALPKPTGIAPSLRLGAYKVIACIVHRDFAVGWNALEPDFQYADQQALAEPTGSDQELELVCQRGKCLPT